MADIWSGDILLEDGTSIQEIVLSSQNAVASRPALTATSLCFLGTVETARIPLYLAAGPSLDVWTTCKATEEWFQSVLLSKPIDVADAHHGPGSSEWWTCARAQSPFGILVQVEDKARGAHALRLTEILFYGTVASSAKTSLPTPPSSSPDVAPVQPESLPELRVHALPLSSDLLYQSGLSDIPPLSPPLDHADAPVLPDAQFLAATFSADPVTAPGSPKRKRDVFEEATQLRRKARRKGGEGISAAAARASSAHNGTTHRKSLSVDTKATPIPESRPASAIGIASRPPSRQLSRSPSIASDSRPLSRRGPESQAKRSTLSQVATVPLQPEEPTIETRNKEALSRVVMAGMRMHGLQQRKKTRSRRSSVAPAVEAAERMTEEAAVEEANKDEEFKLIYHQTYKGAALALRRHIATRPLHLQPDRLRDVVEKLLPIFCTDPLTLPLPSTEAEGVMTTPGAQKRLGVPGSTHSHASPFDLPSGHRAIAPRAPQHVAHTGSPISRQRGPTRQ
ncbi:hypothetical protein K491DRAFT_610348 [Lophiostoma macrostomum CBS 122681]|uniref:Sld7 C-terminal domain-containing protein n=1 Tax=Lophiostoma macrostomum CBS 122681 TaxID=1314788 RepID=A0A6A6STV9_9PLEO|nr:hypothetical protein K491DRAFT_610348 [Lophiostoma macrostomum CBS 122681]